MKEGKDSDLESFSSRSLITSQLSIPLPVMIADNYFKSLIQRQSLLSRNLVLYKIKGLERNRNSKIKILVLASFVVAKRNQVHRDNLHDFRQFLVNDNFAK